MPLCASTRCRRNVSSISITHEHILFLIRNHFQCRFFVHTHMLVECGGRKKIQRKAKRKGKRRKNEKPAKLLALAFVVFILCMCVCVVFACSVILCISSRNHTIHVSVISNAAFNEPISKCFDEGKYLFSFLVYIHFALCNVCACAKWKKKEKKYNEIWRAPHIFSGVWADTRSSRVYIGVSCWSCSLTRFQCVGRCAGKKCAHRPNTWTLTNFFFLIFCIQGWCRWHTIMMVSNDSAATSLSLCYSLSRLILSAEWILHSILCPVNRLTAVNPK